MQHVIITLATFSSLWSRQFNWCLHLAFKIQNAHSTFTLAEHNDLLKSFSSGDKFALFGCDFTNHVQARYAPSPIRRSLTFSPSITLVGSLSKLLLSAWKYSVEFLKMGAPWNPTGKPVVMSINSKLPPTTACVLIEYF